MIMYQGQMHTAKENKLSMDPPEKREARFYALGEIGKPEDMAEADDDFLAVAQLRPNDPCFVRRSGGSYTFAKVISFQHIKTATYLELQVDGTGATKSIPLHQCVNYVRPMQNASHWKMKRPDVAQGRSSEVLPHRARRRASVQPNIEKSHPALKRQSISSFCEQGLNKAEKPAVANRRASVNASFLFVTQPKSNSSQSSLQHEKPANVTRRASVNARASLKRAPRSNGCESKPATSNRRSSVNAALKIAQKSQALRRGSCSSGRCRWTEPTQQDEGSQHVHVVPFSTSKDVADDLFPDPAVEGEVHSDLESRNSSQAHSHKSTSSPVRVKSTLSPVMVNDDTCLPTPSKSPQGILHFKNTEKPLDCLPLQSPDNSLKKASLPGGIGDIQFNQEMLMRAFKAVPFH